MNVGIARAGFIARCYMKKEAAGVSDLLAHGVLGAGKAVRGAGKALTGAGKAWGKGSEAIGQSVTQQLQQAGVRGARSKGALTTAGLKTAPWLVGGYYGYKTFEPEVQSAKQRLGQAVRGRIALFKARRRAAMPYYHEGRFM